MDIITLALALKKAKGYTDTVANKLAGGLRYKGSVASASELPTSKSIGDLYTTTDSGHEYVYDGTSWVNLSNDLDLKQNITDNTLNTTAKTIAAAINEVKLTADAAYVKPETGIPASDMTAAVQTSLALADSALQSHQDISNKTDKQINGTNGISYIFNESDGGGAKFEHTDGLESFVGVNNGGENGLAAQIYADKYIDGHWQGAKLDVKNDGIYYTVGNKSFAERAVSENELATKGWVENKNYLTEHQDISNKLNILPNVDDENDPGYGYPYWIPYNFEFTPEADKMNLKLHTLTLDNNFLKMDFEKDIPVATTTVAGFMSAADKVKLESALQEHQDLSEYAKTTEVNSAVATAVNNLVNGAPETLDTLKEIADNIGVLEGKQDSLTAGDNITIAADGKTISATDTKYTVTIEL